jgi:hypothetical protein
VPIWFCAQICFIKYFSSNLCSAAILFTLMWHQEHLRIGLLLHFLPSFGLALCAYTVHQTLMKSTQDAPIHGLRTGNMDRKYVGAVGR